MKEIELINGTVVRTETVTNFAVQHLIGQCPVCRMPPPPIEEIKGKVGVTQATARPGTPMYAEWEQECLKVREIRTRVEDDARVYLGVQDWKGVDDQKFHTQVPDEWAFPSKLSAMGVKSYEEIFGEVGLGTVGREWDYIIFGLLTNNRDVVDVINTLYIPREEGPIQGGEVDSMSELFPGDEGEETDTSGTGE